VKNIAALQGQKLMRGRSASEYYFSGVECNFRVFQGIFPGAKKIQGLPGLLATLCNFITNREIINFKIYRICSMLSSLPIWKLIISDNSLIVSRNSEIP